jgi:hypothetical protein
MARRKKEKYKDQPEEGGGGDDNMLIYLPQYWVASMDGLDSQADVYCTGSKQGKER